MANKSWKWSKIRGSREHERNALKLHKVLYLYHSLLPTATWKNWKGFFPVLLKSMEKFFYKRLWNGNEQLKCNFLFGWGWEKVAKKKFEQEQEREAHLHTLNNSIHVSRASSPIKPEIPLQLTLSRHYKDISACSFHSKRKPKQYEDVKSILETTYGTNTFTVNKLFNDWAWTTHRKSVHTVYLKWFWMEFENEKSVRNSRMKMNRFHCRVKPEPLLSFIGVCYLFA